MNGDHRTGVIAIGLFIILLSPILLIHAHDVSAQYQDNTSLSTGKATYALHETVCITLTAAPEKIVFFNIISPTGIIYTALSATDHEYQLKPDIAGSYVVNVLLHTGGGETLLTTEFVVVDPKIVFGAPEQGGAVVGEPVNWSQRIYVTNHEKFFISNFSVSIPLPPDHSNPSSGAGSAIIDSSIPVDLAAGEGASFNISYQTPPVRLAVAEEMIGISDLIPPDAFDIGVYKEICVDEGGQLTDKIAVKRVTVRHNSSVYYHNIPVAIESQGFDEIVEFVDDAGMVAEMTTERSNETLSWTIPKLSNRTYTVVGVTREQGDAEIGEPVEWQLNVSGTIVRYKTPAPFTMESKPVIADGTWQKEIVVGSNASVYYSDVTAYSRLGETEKSNLRLFWLANGSRIDVTDSEEFDVSFSDTNGNGTIDMATWNVPMLSNQSFEVEAGITVINVQSYPTVGGNWTVEFETVGCANLTITAVDGTAWSNADEEEDLRFLKIKCGDQTLNYRWINDSVFIENYCCNLTGHEVSKVLTPATHTLRFRFGSDVGYAHNWATDLSGWGHRQLINISNTAGELSYHQVKIELNSSNDGTNWNWTNNGNDTRFTYYNSTTGTETEIPFWIESWNSTAETSTTWVNVTSLANNANTTIYLYYGNTSASSASNGTNTFEFFDDFEIFNAGDWAKENSGSTLSQESDPAISGRGQVLKYDGNGWYAFKKTTYTFTNGTIHFEFYRPSPNAEIQFCWRIANISHINKNFYEFVEKEECLKFQKFVNNTESKDIHTKDIICPVNTWNNSKIVANGSSIKYWVDGTEHLSFSDTKFSSGNLGGRCKHDMYLNDIFVCTYASSEPTVNIGIEETLVSLNLTISTPQNNSCTNDNTTTFAGTTNIAANITYSVDANTNETACNNCTSFSNTTQELTDGPHNITVYGATYDHATDTDSETVYFTVDTTAPASITSLANQSSGGTWINWTWTNPTDADFDHIEVWINETFYANVTQPAHSYTATGLDATSWYEIRTRTVDDCQNVNTTWVNDTAKTQEMSWGDYHQLINISNTAQNLSYYPVRIDLNSSNVETNWNWTEDENATRFTYYNYTTETETEIPFWIESWNSTAETSTIWVNVTSLANNTNTTIYLYYGSTSASSASNGTNTFEFFDDFPGSSLDGAKWPYHPGTPVVSESTVLLDGGDKICSPIDFGIPCSMRARSKASANDSVFLETYYANTSESYGLQLGTSDQGTHGPTIIRTQVDDNGRDYRFTDTGVAWKNYAIYEITRVSIDIARCYQNDYLLCNETEKVFDAKGYVGFHVWGASSTVTVDWVFVRKYASPEPVVSIGTQPRSCPYGDICVNEIGWWYNNSVLNTSSTQIQNAIDNATDGDSIYVYNGNYTENVDVTKQLTLTGEGTDGVKVTNSTADSHVFNVSANYVNISRFNVTGATGNMKAGIYIGKSVDQCNISSNTVSDNYIGIYLDSSSSGNRLADNIISDNIWDNYLASSTSAFSNNTLSGTTVSLTYSGDILLKGVGSPASDPTGQNNIDKFINVTNQSVGAWTFLNFSYSDADLSGPDESSLAVWKYNGTAWVEDGWNGSRYLDTANNVVGVNATSFSVFAPMGSSSSCPSCTVSVTPGDLKANSTGTFTAIINCTAPSGINTSRFIMTQTVEGGIYPEGPPNRWSIRPPMNDIAQSNGSFPQILRAYNRGKGDWYDFAGLFTDNYSYAVHDITRSHVTITNGSKWAELNYTGVVEPTVFRNNFFLDRKQLEIETKKEYNVYANHPLLIKFWDLEHIRGAADYTACAFRNIHYSGTPTADLKAYYCNNSYKTVSEELPNYGASDATANMTGNVLLMHLDEMSEIIVDYSGAGNNGTNNGAEYGAPGKINTSLSFNGSDSVNVSSSSSLNMGGSDFTIEVWAKTDSTWSAERLLVKHGIGETGTYQLTTENSENFKVNFYGMSSSDGCLCNVDWTDGQWHHLVGVFDNSANYLCTYYDGKLCAATPETNAPDSVDGLLHIGSGGTEKFFDGELDEVAVYNRSLSADEIKANYKRGIRKPSRDTDNCVCLNTLGAADLNDIYYTSRNSSYSRSCYGINGNKIAGINATGTYYIAYESDTTAGNCYSVRYANGSSGTNVSFADSNVAWSSTDDADNWIQAQFTPDLWFSAITDGDRFQLGVYAESNVGSNHTNFTLYTDDIGDINYPISNPSIAYYENAGGTKDYDLTGLYAGDMTININMAKDPDAPGTVKHSLYLYNSNGMLNTTINSSFYSQDDSNVNVIFDTSMVSDAEYRIKVTAVDGDNSSDVESYLTTVNFTIDNTAPTIQLNDPADKADLSSSTVNFNWTTTDNLDGALSCDLTIDGVTNQSGITSISGQPTNYSVPGISNGSHNWYMTCRDDAANAVISETRTFGINDSAPDVTLNSPPNGSVTPNNWVIVNATVTDADDDNMTVCFYADDSINGLNASEGLVYIEDNVADGSAITYKLTALPVKPDEDGLAMLMHFDNRGEYGEHTERGVANAVYDFTGNGNNGTLGSATTSTAPVWDVTGGKFAGTFEFDGSDDYIDCGDDSSLNLDNSSFTVSLWFNTISNATNVRQTLLSKGSTHTSNNTCLHLDLFRDNNESINMRFWGNDLEVNTKITANTWHHAAFAYNTSDMNQTIYLDGACVGFKNIATNLTGTNGDSIRIGRRACGENDNPFNGAIDEVALYTRTLSATEILNQYRLEKGKYYWKVNTTDGVLSNESDVWNFYAGYNPDLRVINVTFDQWNTSENRSAISETGSGCHVKENRNIAINVTIANYADENVTSNFDVSFFDSAGVSGNWSRCFWNSTYNVSTDGELGSITTGDPHNTTYITGYWNPSLVGTHNISVWADPANSASESAANTTNNNASAVINVSAWQKYYGNVSGSIVLSDSASDSLYDWTWSNESDVGYAYIVKNGASINWSALHALGCDSNNALNASGHDFHDADTNLGMVVGSNNSTGFVDNNITELFGGGSPSTASFRAPFTVYGNLISNVPIINSTIMVNHTSVESANFVTGILWDATSDTNGYYDATNETLVFVTKIRVAATGLGGAAHNYEFAAPCTLNPVVGGDMDIYMELK